MSKTDEIIAAGGIPVEGRIVFDDVILRREGEEFLLGKKSDGNFVVIPIIAGEFMEILATGATVGGASQMLYERGYQDEIDADQFLGRLNDLGMLRDIITDREEKYPPTSFFAGNQAVSGSVFFNKFSFIAIFVIFIASITVVLFNQKLWPSYSFYFWGQNLAVVLLVNSAIMIGIGLVHELFHIEAARSLGVPARFSLGTRLTNLVFQTEAYSLWAVESKYRYRVFFAGVIWDSMVFSAMVFTATFFQLGPVFQGIARATMLSILMSWMLQAQFFMRTDLYFTVANALGCKNLFGDSMEYLKSRFRPLVARVNRTGTEFQHSSPLASLPLRERKIVKVYSWFALAGSVIFVSLFLYFGVQITVGLLVRSFLTMMNGISGGNLLTLLNGLVVLSVIVAIEGMTVGVFIRNRRKRRSSPVTGTQA